MSRPRSPDDRRAALTRGSNAEARVAAILEDEGWLVVARNVRLADGELDLVVRRGSVLRFVEVKARAADDLHGPEVSLGPQKRGRLVRAAEAWIAGSDDAWSEAAFLVALVEGDHVELIDDAFDA